MVGVRRVSFRFLKKEGGRLAAARGRAGGGWVGPRPPRNPPRPPRRDGTGAAAPPPSRRGAGATSRADRERSRRRTRQARRLRRRTQRRPFSDRVARHRRFRSFPCRHRQASAEGGRLGAPLRARPVHQGRGGAASACDQRRRRRAGARPRCGNRTRDGPLQPRRRAGLRRVAVTALWEGAVAAAPKLEQWIAHGSAELEVARLPRSAWPIVAGATARAITQRGRPVLILVPGPERFADELRLWLAGRPSTYVFAEVAGSFLDRPPAFDEAVNRRLEALAALADKEPVVVVSSRRAITRQTISRGDLLAGTVVLKPGQGPDPVTVAGRLVELGYTRERPVEDRGQFSLPGGILDVFPSAADAPVRAEWSGDLIETLRLFDSENQRSVMPIPDATIRTGRELLIGPERGSAAVDRLRESVSFDSLRGDVRSEWEDELARLGVGAAFAGVEFYAAYLDPSRPSLLDHLPEGAVVLDFEPGRQLVDARTLP